VLTVEDWAEPSTALHRLREWAEAYADEAILWYLRGKRGKRLGSRILRALAIALAVAGVVAALLSGGGLVSPSVGYVLLTLGAGCLAFDYFFGFSAGWTRDMATAQALQRRLLHFELAWTGWQTAQAGYGPDQVPPLPPSAEWHSPRDRDARRNGDDARDGDAGDVEAARQLIEELVLAVARLTGEETGRWAREFPGNGGTAPGAHRR
jgi:hypothetical protein